MANIILGIGTGRNGSKSLAEFLNNQPDINFTHEKCELAMDSVLCTFAPAVDRLGNLDIGTRYYGDISPFWIYYMGEFMTLFPSTRIIWLRRQPIGDVINSYYSYMKLTAQGDQHPKYGWYPVGEEKFSHAAISRAVKKNEWLNEVAARLWPERVLELRTDQLNIEECQYQVLDWLGIPENRHVYGMPHLNKRQERVSWAEGNPIKKKSLNSWKTLESKRHILGGLTENTLEVPTTSG